MMSILCQSWWGHQTFKIQFNIGDPWPCSCIGNKIWYWHQSSMHSPCKLFFHARLNFYYLIIGIVETHTGDRLLIQQGLHGLWLLWPVLWGEVSGPLVLPAFEFIFSVCTWTRPCSPGKKFNCLGSDQLSWWRRWRKYKYWRQWKFLWSLNKTAPSCVAPNWELHRVCCRK